MPLPVHLTEADYQKLFPQGVDEFPSVINEQHYIDAWLLNTAFASLEEIETYLLTYQANIEALIGNDIIGDDGNPIINIPAARYPAYKTAMAWDSELLEENIKKDITIFGVTGTLLSGSGGINISIPTAAAIDNAWVYSTPPTLTIDSSIPSVAAPTVSAA